MTLPSGVSRPEYEADRPPLFRAVINNSMTCRTPLPLPYENKSNTGYLHLLAPVQIYFLHSCHTVDMTPKRPQLTVNRI